MQNFYDLFRFEITDGFIKENQHILIQQANQIYKNKVNLLDIISIDLKKRENEIKENIVEEKRLFNRYLKQKNSLLIDFGGTGTIL